MAGSRKSLTLIKQKWRFFGKKDPLLANFHKCFPKPPQSTWKHVFCGNFVKFGRPEVGEIARCLMDKKIRLALPLPLLHGSRPKFVKDSPNNVLAVPQIPKFHPNPFTSGGVIAERVNIVQTHHKVFAYSAKLELLR